MKSGSIGDGRGCFPFQKGMLLHINKCAYVLSHFSHVQLFVTLRTCSPPSSSIHGDSPGKNIGVGCHALLQGILKLSLIDNRFVVAKGW